MKSTILFLFLAGVVAVNAQNLTATTEPPSNNATTTTPKPTTVTPATTTVTTQNATTVANQTTTVTTKPTTHEVTTNNESNTTHAVTTATAQTTTPAPTPADRQLFKVQEGGVVCILLNVTFEFKFDYKDDKNKSETFSMPMPKGAVGSGKCNTSSPYMTITFGPNKDMLTMHFAQKDSMTYIENVSLNFTMDKTFPGITVDKKEHSQSKAGETFYKYASGSAFTCQSNQTMGLKGDVDVTVTTIDMELEAFRSTNTSDFDTKNVVSCPADSVTSNIVPIAVGAALAALVVIVLIAYLISRNRNKRGYESV